jgi:ferredoxin-NADP reductase
VVKVVRETDAVCTLGLEVRDWSGHLAGQHVDVRLTAPDGYQAQRSYSIASGPEDEAVELTVERLVDGEVSPYLVHELHEGDELELRGPIGGYFVWRPELGGPVQLIAGGSGVVPLRSILRHWSAAGSDAPMRLLYSARGWEDVIFREELSRLGSAVQFTLTRSWPEGWTGGRGRIDAEVLSEAAFPPSDDPLVYVCGPTPMVESVAGALVTGGHRPERIRTERFGATGG